MHHSHGAMAGIVNTMHKSSLGRRGVPLQPALRNSRFAAPTTKPNKLLGGLCWAACLFKHCEMSWKLAFGQQKAPALASLQAAPSRTLYRKRAFEVEDCVLLGHEKPVAKQVRLRSFPTSEPASLVFVNCTHVHVRVIWLTFEGEECLYSAVAPGTRVRYLTYADSHVWIVREVNTGRRMQLNGAQAVVASSDASLTVDIRDPPSLPFQESTYAAFPTEFQELVRTVLLCHNRCNAGVGSSAGNCSSSTCLTNLSSGVPGGPAAQRCNTLGQSAAALSSLPKDLLLAIITMAAPSIRQDAAVPLGHPDVQPCQWRDAETFNLLVEGTKARQEECKATSLGSCRLQ